MSFLVYWYGTKRETDCYGFVGQKFVVSYEQEKAKGNKSVHTIPSKIQIKIDEGSPLNPKEEDIARTYREVDEDLSVEPKDRKRGVLSFPEGYEMLSYKDFVGLNMRGENDDDEHESELSDTDGGELTESPEPKADAPKAVPLAKKSKAAKNVKRGKAKNAIAGVDEDEDDDTAVQVYRDGLVAYSNIEVPLLEGKKRGRKKSSDPKVQTISPVKKVKPNKKKLDNDEPTSGGKKSAKMVNAPETAAVNSDGLGDAEDERTDDEKSVEYALHEVLSSHDEADADDDFVVAKKLNAVELTRESKKEKPFKKSQKTKPKIDKPQNEKQRKSKEVKEFKQCEANYLPLIRNWQSAIKADDIGLLQSLLVEADHVVENFCSSFILSYDLSSMCKDTKKALKAANADIATFTVVKEKIKTTFEQKKTFVPKSFKPPKAMPESKIASEAMSINKRGLPRTKILNCKIHPPARRVIRPHALRPRAPTNCRTALRLLKTALGIVQSEVSLAPRRYLVVIASRVSEKDREQW